MMKIKFFLFLVNICLLLFQPIFSFFPCTKSTLSSLLSAKSLLLYFILGGWAGYTLDYILSFSPPPPPQPQNTLSKKPNLFRFKMFTYYHFIFSRGPEGFPPPFFSTLFLSGARTSIGDRSDTHTHSFEEVKATPRGGAYLLPDKLLLSN